MARALFTLLAVGLAGCTGTPMPIPPSIAPEALIPTPVEPTPDRPECLDGCVEFAGSPGVAGPGDAMVLHRLDFVAYPPLEIAIFDYAVADEWGRFSFLLGGGPEGAFRVIAHNDDGVSMADFSVEGDSGAWLSVPLGDGGPTSCIALEPSSVSFGAVAVGDIATVIVGVENRCGTPLFLVESAVVAGPADGPSPAFDALPRRIDLGPGERTTVAVVYWPDSPGPHRGALLLLLEDSATSALLVPSLPIRGRTE